MNIYNTVLGIIFLHAFKKRQLLNLTAVQGVAALTMTIFCCARLKRKNIIIGQKLSLAIV